MTICWSRSTLCTIISCKNSKLFIIICAILSGGQLLLYFCQGQLYCWPVRGHYRKSMLGATSIHSTKSLKHGHFLLFWGMGKNWCGWKAKDEWICTRLSHIHIICLNMLFTYSGIRKRKKRQLHCFCKRLHKWGRTLGRP